MFCLYVIGNPFAYLQEVQVGETQSSRAGLLNPINKSTSKALRLALGLVLSTDINSTLI